MAKTKKLSEADILTAFEEMNLTDQVKFFAEIESRLAEKKKQAQKAVEELLGAGIE